MGQDPIVVNQAKGCFFVLISTRLGINHRYITPSLAVVGRAANACQRPSGSAIPDEMDLIALVPVGYTDKEPSPKERKPVEEVCEILK